MGRFCRLSRVVVLVAAITGFNSAAIAQSISDLQPQANETLAETFDRAFFANDPDFFRNRSFKRQLSWMFGLGSGSLFQDSFPENEITRDGKLIHKLYTVGLEQQVSSDPIIRTRDLPNPYETSILTSPAFNVNNQVEENELLFERR